MLVILVHLLPEIVLTGGREKVIRCDKHDVQVHVNTTHKLTHNNEHSSLYLYQLDIPTTYVGLGKDLLLQKRNKIVVAVKK